jgi:hypothetical protein
MTRKVNNKKYYEIGERSNENLNLVSMRQDKMIGISNNPQEKGPMRI